MGVERPNPRMSGLTTLKCRARCGIQSYHTIPLSAQPWSSMTFSGVTHGSTNASVS
jgi:hypothetical protein